jgi:hypothetical protein
MKPFLIALARRVKTRVRIRGFRERLAADVALGRADAHKEETE